MLPTVSSLMYDDALNAPSTASPFDQRRRLVPVLRIDVVGRVAEMLNAAAKSSLELRAR
jgi:hypothetical protein